MSDRTPIIAGNWKMFKTNSEAAAYIAELKGLVASVNDVEIVVSPPFTCLSDVRREVEGANIRVAAQNMHFEAEGAYTGEISAAMLKEIGVEDVILGHSERREYFCESDEDLARKVPVAINAGIRPILCCGETDTEREAGKTEEKLSRQLTGDLSQVDASSLAAMVIAYEPIWAIGTGKTATPEIAQETIGFIRETLASLFDEETASLVRILYGGSVKPSNINELMAQPDIDGALVGGACLQAQDFASIVRFG